MLRSVVVRVVVCCGLVAAALLLELHYNLATYIQQVVTTGPTPAVRNIVLLKTQKVYYTMHGTIIYCEAQRMVWQGPSSLIFTRGWVKGEEHIFKGGGLVLRPTMDFLYLCNMMTV